MSAVTPVVETDEVLHGTTHDGDRIIRIGRASRWCRESPDGSRTRLSVAFAARLAVMGTARLGQPGGSQFDGRVRRFLAAAEKTHDEAVRAIRKFYGDTYLQGRAAGMDQISARRAADAATMEGLIRGTQKMIPLPLMSCGCVTGEPHGSVTTCQFGLR